MLVRLNSSTKKLCVIGDPIGHSLSPLLHNTMLSALGLDYVYLWQRVPADGTCQWVKSALFTGHAGFNATMPHKQALLPLLDSVDPEARRYGAVNTVCIREGKLCGYNTDGRGFCRALADLEVDPAEKRVMLLGAGGAAQAVALALLDRGARSVTVCNRTLSRAQALCSLSPRLAASDLSLPGLTRLARASDLLVNCTSLGMEGTGGQFDSLDFLSALPPHAAVCDLIYAPRETALLARARALGHPAMNGLGMLIYQAIFSLELFTGVPIDPGEMAALLREKLF